MSDSLYAKELLRLAAQAAGAGVLDPCDATGRAHNPICGDRISVTMCLEGNRILRLAHETQACVLTQASASILGAKLPDADLHAVEALYRDVREMLQGNGAPVEPFDDYKALMGAAMHRNRHKCVLLPIEAVLNAMGAAN
jgi:nitrogen fixation NifU-like protein